MDLLDFLKKQTSRLQLKVQEEEKTIDELTQKTKRLEAVRDQIGQGWLQVERENSRLVAALNNLPFGFVFTDDRNNITHSTAGLDNLLGKPPSNKWTLDDIQQRLRNFDLKITVSECLKTRSPAKPKDVYFEKKILRIFVAPINILKESLAVIGTVIVFENVTEEKLRQNLQNDFFAMSSHELKAPLAAMRANIELILDQHTKTLEKDVKKLLENVHLDATHLVRTVHDFIDLPSLELNKIPFKMAPVDVSSIIEFITEDLKNSAVQKNIYLKVEKIPNLPKVQADPDRLRQVLYNLIENSLKFTTDGGISISAEKSKGYVKIRVSDTGPGITEEDVNLLFKKYHTTGEGSGIGLYLSKILIEKMGGQIYLEKTKVGQGSTFAFTLKIAKNS